MDTYELYFIKVTFEYFWDFYNVGSPFTPLFQYLNGLQCTEWSFTFLFLSLGLEHESW